MKSGLNSNDFDARLLASIMRRTKEYLVWLAVKVGWVDADKASHMTKKQLAELYVSNHA